MTAVDHYTVTLEIETTPLVSSTTILGALSAEGVVGAVVGTVPLRLAVPAVDTAVLARRVCHALERVLLDAPLPLVPQRVGPMSFVLRPAAA